MINFINFITTIVWAFTKLGMAILLFCVIVLCLKPTLKETAVIVKDCWKKRCDAWTEVQEMERAEYGD
ncbi:MAG: hypothetical protein IKU47_03465 [Oscillospiraceae bacterium]|nr:hypothetical protein [Oscillospiraceae bacterium]